MEGEWQGLSCINVYKMGIWALSFRQIKNYFIGEGRWGGENG